MLKLDVTTMMVVLAAVSFVQLIIFYLDSYRRTRTDVARWWAASVACFSGASICYTIGQVENISPIMSVGSGIMAIAAGCMWVGARRMRGRPAVIWPLLLLGAATTTVSMAGRSVGDTAPGQAAWLVAMGIGIGAAAVELRIRHSSQWRDVRSFAIMATVAAVYFLARAAGVLLMGPTNPVFLSLFGTGVTFLVAILLLVSATSTMTALNNAQRTAQLREQATLDGLTGLLNRVRFLEEAESLLRRSRDNSTVCSVVMADLDRFKAINDEFGHITGDAVLQAFGDACRMTVRTSDLVGRYGGEEFIMLLPSSTAPEAVRVADRINVVLAETGPLRGTGRMATASFGIADTSTGFSSLTELIARADRALYAAKNQGRNRTMIGDGQAA
ncbi:GGDEF domain-containing protein [Tersicoccus sp. Bi-70]|uniref:GGDEF domain-containing protein n=1 Tax=Tersicoccus sp. Bi-70 TaxID=1897634 RepID=UPI0009F955C9|nr:GGDEF domain-containing protein [Tersicoccus sp. Bi-70]